MSQFNMTGITLFNKLDKKYVFGVTSVWLWVYHSSAACGQPETVLDLGLRFLACLTFWADTTIASDPIGNSFPQANVFSRQLL